MNTNAYAATHDAITHLPNKFLFLDRLKQAIAISERSTNRFALLIVTLNNYTAIHDEHGQTFSDRLILQVAERLQETLREPDTIARGEENTFVMLLPQVESELNLTQLIWRIEKALAEPFQIDFNKIHISISIGQGTYPSDGTNALKLLQYVELQIKNSLR